MDECHVEPIEKQATAVENEQITDGRMLIWGMGCPNCAARVRNSLVSLNGVVEAVVDHNSGIGRVFFNPNLVSVQELEQAVIRAGGDGRHEYLGKMAQSTA